MTIPVRGNEKGARVLGAVMHELPRDIPEVSHIEVRPGLPSCIFAEFLLFHLANGRRTTI